MSYRSGDGDQCPVVAGHGAMFVIQSRPPTQYCPYQSHDGVWVGPKSPPTRSHWPYHGFEAAAAAHKAAAGPPQLPDLDLGGFRA